MAHQTKAAAAPTKVLTGWQRFASVFREAHPMGREPRYLKAHNLPGAMYYFRRLGRTSSMFVPVMVGFCKYSHPQLASVVDDEEMKANECHDSRLAVPFQGFDQRKQRSEST